MNKMDQFGQIMSQASHLYGHWAKQKGINYNYLAIFHSLVRLTACPQKQICTLWALPKQTVSMACQKLYADGLIDYVPAENDKREKLLILTAQGKALAEPIVAELDEVEQQILDRFGDARAQFLLNELSELQMLLQQNLVK
ncbi:MULTISPECIES: MarR family winged helix-turn-helix transcriptional regulator [Glaesserella]|uniref:MarR family transcriptional regulator n=1 Tax=Glaesserella australis TaxID=2094024 RepID=A0A328C5Y2_9PAST|nr:MULTISPECIES: MarR family winged helix-turn-helix transcriptional regulator [Glaesserella]AUI66863.1 MarR family transcriptional regulator [Glaesserella sp. 15-184]RAL19914.1 MarR family transcriptional regulator [Glaesserella australis]